MKKYATLIKDMAFNGQWRPLIEYLALEPYLTQYPAIKYSYLIELKYIKPTGNKTGITQEQIKKLREEAETQLNQYSIDEKYSKTLGRTRLVKLALIFCGHRLVYHGEIEPTS